LVARGNQFDIFYGFWIRFFSILVAMIIRKILIMAPFFRDYPCHIAALLAREDAFLKDENHVDLKSTGGATSHNTALF